MRASLLLAMAVLLTLAACTSAPLFPNNESNETNFSADIGDDTVDTPIDEEPTNDTVTDETPDDTRNGDYAAVIEAVAGERIVLATRATDPDGDEVTLSFDEPFDEEGTWQTQAEDAGEYEVTVTASDGKAETTALLLVIVQPANQPPRITGPDTITVREGETIDLGQYTIIDPDGDEFVTSYSGWMSGRTYETTFDDAGEHRVRVIAEDEAGNEAVKEVTVVVENVNREPVIELSQEQITVIEGETVDLGGILSVSDPDGGDVSVEFEEPFDEAGAWRTKVGDAGTYRITVTADDGEAEATETVRVTVEPANRPPVIEIDDVIRVNEGQTVDLESAAVITDPEGEEVTVSYSGWMDSATYTTTYDDAGEYEVTIRATDGEHTVRESVTVVVEDTNRPPQFIRPA